VSIVSNVLEELRTPAKDAIDDEALPCGCPKKTLSPIYWDTKHHLYHRQPEVLVEESKVIDGVVTENS